MDKIEVEDADAFFTSAPPLKDRDAIVSKVEEFSRRRLPNDANGQGMTKDQGWYLMCLMQMLSEGWLFSDIHQSKDPLLTCFKLTGDKGIQPASSYAVAVQKAVTGYRLALDGGHLLNLPYTTLFEYIQILQIVSLGLNQLQRNYMFYLAAAVSDFYVPYSSMVEHKIQSGVGPMAMELAQVPKMLSLLHRLWAPEAFCVSFKLETDINILIKKAQAARERYGMHAVVANELETRKQKVIVVTSVGETVIEKDASEADVEIPLVEFLVALHASYIETRGGFI